MNSGHFFYFLIKRTWATLKSVGIYGSESNIYSFKNKFKVKIKLKVTIIDENIIKDNK